jgi:hypothetical protein
MLDELENGVKSLRGMSEEEQRWSTKRSQENTRELKDAAATASTRREKSD